MSGKGGGKAFEFILDADAGRKIANSAEAKAFIDARLEDCLAEAQRTAPVDTGEYRDSLGITPAAERPDGTVAGELWSDSWYWHLVEYGSVNNPPHRVLEHAVTSSGLDFEDGPR